MWLALFGGIAGKLAAAYAARENAKTDAERIAADVTIKQLEARRDALQSGGMVTAWVQALWAAPFIVYVWKLVVWDKVLGLGATDGLSDSLEWVMVTIVGFYFLTTGAKSIISQIKR